MSDQITATGSVAAPLPPRLQYVDTDTGEVIDGLPVCNVSDPADLEAWYGNFGFFEHFRKIMLADCRQLVRAQALANGTKITADTADDLARLSDGYLEFITANLRGRRLRERNAQQSRLQP